MKKLLLVDGYSLTYRAFYALPHLTTSKGLPVNAVYGMASMTIKILKQEKPDYVAFFFDCGIPIDKIDIFPQYKAQREEMSEHLCQQIPLIKQMIAAFGFRYYEIEGYEADDLIAAVVNQLKDKEIQVRILSGDLDMLQMVSPKVTLLMPRKGISDISHYGPIEIKERYGLTPEQLPDWKALAGDSADNIPGIPGIGRKTATQLIQKWGTLEAVLKNISQIENTRIRTAIKNYSEKALAFRSLTRLNKDIPLNFSLDQCLTVNYRNENIKKFFAQMEFTTLIKRLGLEKEVTAYEPEDVKPLIIVDKQKMKQFKEILNSQTEISLNLLLSQNKPPSFQIKEIIVAMPDESVFVFPEYMISDFLQELKNFLEKENNTLICYDSKQLFAVFDDVNINCHIHDLLLIAHLVDPEKTNSSLSKLIQSFLTDIEEKLSAYNETRYMFPLQKLLLPRIRQENLDKVYCQLELPLARVLSKMERNGVEIDIAYLQEFSSQLSQEIFKITRAIYTLAGEGFNINSTKQTANILFNKLKLPPGKKTKGGYSTDTEELERLAPQYRIATEILKYREYQKLKSTYIDAFPRIVIQKKLYTTYHQAGTVTGRISSTDPNLQNIPIKTPLGSRIRRAFIPRLKDNLILSADYSQIELRLLAHFSQDPFLTESFFKDADIHAYTARELFDVELSAVTPEMRRIAKTVNFGIIYGMTEFGLAQSLKIKKSEAQEFIHRYFSRLTGVKKFIKETLEAARKSKKVMTIAGRYRNLTYINSRNKTTSQQWERIAINTIIQGSAADIIKMAMLNIQHSLEARNLSTLMIMQVHDELVFDLPQKEIKEAASIIRKEMEGCIDLNVPLKVEIKAGPNWKDMEPVE